MNYCYATMRGQTFATSNFHAHPHFKGKCLGSEGANEDVIEHRRDRAASRSNLGTGGGLGLFDRVVFGVHGARDFGEAGSKVSDVLHGFVHVKIKKGLL